MAAAFLQFILFSLFLVLLSMSFWYSLRRILASPSKKKLYTSRFLFSVFLLAVVVGVYERSMALALQHDAYMAGFTSLSEYRRAREENIHTPEEWFAHTTGLELVILSTQAQIVPNNPIPQESSPSIGGEAASSQPQATVQGTDDINMCRDDPHCWGLRAAQIASGECADLIERSAPYDFLWTNWFWEPRFSEYRWASQPDGYITLIGEQLKFQNVFGAWAYKSYQCRVNPATGQVLGIVLLDRSPAEHERKQHNGKPGKQATKRWPEQ